MRSAPVTLGLILLLMLPVGLGADESHGAYFSPYSTGYALQSPDTINVAALRRWPPYYRWRDDGEPTGFAVETFRDIAERAGLVPRFRRFPGFPEAIEALRSGTIDVIPNLGDVSSRRGLAAFTGPVQTFPVVLFTREDGPDPTDLTEAADLTLGAVRENVGAELLAGRTSGSNELYAGLEEALFALLAGEIDALVFPRPVLLAVAREIGADDEINASETPLLEVKRAIGVRPDRRDLLVRLDSAVAGYVGSSTYEQRYRRWFGRTEPFWTAEHVAWAAGGGLLLVVFFFAGWRYRTVHRLNEELKESQNRYGRLLSEISDVVTLLGEDSTIRYQSPSIEKVLGYEPEELIGRPVFDLIHPDDDDRVREAFVAAMEGQVGPKYTVQYRIRSADGAWRFVESSGVLAEDDALGFVVVTRDITDRVEAQQMFRAIFNTAPGAVALTTLNDGELVEVNPAFQELLGYAPEEAIGATVGELGIWAHPEQRESLVAQLRDTGSVTNVEAEFRDAGGDAFDVLFSGSALEFGGNRYMVGIAQDITERKQFEQELERRALHDSLTDLPNRTLLSDRIEQAVARVRRHDEALGLAMLDIDHFKRVNDRLGHTAGDRVLVEFARRLQSAVREQDTVARWGGDEFSVVLPGLEGPEVVADVIERLREVVSSPFQVGGEAVPVEFTAGAVVYSADESSRTVQTERPEELIRFGSLALHWARESHAEFKLFDPGVPVEGASLFRRERELYEALERGEIVPYYQPVVRLADGALVGVEALARWRHPDRGLLPPSEFIALAVELGLIRRLGEEIVRKGSREAAEWQRAGRGDSRLLIGFNFAGQQFDDPELAPNLERWVGEAGLRPEQVMLEVTETSLMQAPSRIEDLRDVGFRVFVDDFGTGYSTFTYLRDFEVDGLKIDMSFVQNLPDSRANVILLETILTLGRRFELSVIAEGVETEEQRKKLQELGCERGQGYLFARPMPGDEMGTVWREERSEIE